MLAYSLRDDKWGTARSVDVLMGEYPYVERRHVSPEDLGIDPIGHMGLFRPDASALWHETAAWLAG